MKNWLHILFLLVAMGTFSSTDAHAKNPDEAEFLAAGYLGYDIADWVMDQKTKPESLGIYSIHSNPPLENDFSQMLETEIIQYLTKKELNKITSCGECRNSQVTVYEDRVVVSKGAPDIETVKRLGAKLPVDQLLVVEVYRSKLSVIAQATLYENHSGTIIGSKQFKASAVTFSDSAVQVLMTYGLGKTLTQAAAATTSQYSFAANLSLLEEVGFGKAGLTFGGAFGSGGSLLYINPTLSFRGRFGSGSIMYAVILSGGWGIGGGGQGPALRGALEFHLGNLTVIGAEFTYFLPDRVVNGPTGFYGVHVGLSFGR